MDHDDIDNLAQAPEDGPEGNGGPIPGAMHAPWATDRPGLRHQALRAGLVGLGAGAVAVAFLLLVRVTDDWRQALLAFARGHPLLVAALVLAASAAAALAGYITERFAPEAAGSGIPHVKAVLHDLRVLRYKRVLPVKFIGGVLALGSGLSLGREGPTVQMGAAVGQAVSLMLKLPRRMHNQLIAAGAGAGLAAAFNAPLAGFIFTIEELRRDLSPLTYGMALIATVIADITVRSFLGQDPSFHVQNIATPPIALLPLFFVLGLAACAVGLAFNRLLLWLHVLANTKLRYPRWLRAAVVAAVMALTALLLPYSWGGGYSIADYLLSGKANAALGMLVLLLVLRVVFTAVSYSTGVPGGIFAPMLAMGAILGILLGKVSTLILPSADNVPTALAIVGMAAVFGAVVRAPLTGVILVVEMTGNYHLLLPLMVASMTAYLIAGRLGSPPVYDALLGIDLARTSTPPTSPDDVMWLELVVEDQAPAAHCCVSGLNWPEGCLVVTITRGMHELVPSGHTRLRPGDQLRVVVETDDNLKSAQIVRASTTAPA